MEKYIPKVSIIIIAESWNSFLEEALPKYCELDYKNFEVLVITTEKIKPASRLWRGRGGGLTQLLKGQTPLRFEGYAGSDPITLKFIHSPETKNIPAKKRDLGAKLAKGEILAFIDDDAYPAPNWLKEAIKHFKDKNICAVGGPGVTPLTADVLEQASGWVSASPLGGFGASHRFIPTVRKFVDDLPSMNLLVKKVDFVDVGGFDSNYYPGEDTKLCLDLTKKLGKKILYEPKALVYHHKRPLLIKHLKQNGRYGFHRGHFARKLGGNSRKVFYFVPAVFSIGLLGGATFLILNYQLSIFNKFSTIQLTLRLRSGLANVYFGVLAVYFLLLTFNAFWIYGKSKSLIVSLLTIPGVFLTHFWYGIKFIQGFFSKKTVDTYGRA